MFFGDQLTPPPVLQYCHLLLMTPGEEDGSLERTSSCFLFPFSKTLAGITSITTFTWQFLIFLSFYNMQHKRELMDPPERATASSFFSPSFSKTEAGIQSTAVLLLSVFIFPRCLLVPGDFLFFFLSFNGSWKSKCCLTANFSSLDSSSTSMYFNLTNQLGLFSVRTYSSSTSRAGFM